MVESAFRIEVTSSLGSGAWEASSKSGYWTVGGEGDNWYASYTFETNGPIDIMSSSEPGTVVATLDHARVVYHQDPQVNLDFAVFAGAADTTFNIASALLSFPTISGAQGSASVAYTVQDNNGSGVTLTGLAGAGNGYLAQYNGWAAMEAGSTFTEAIPVLAAGAFQNNSTSVDVPGGGGTLPIGDPVDDMSSLISFELTAFDSASGTSTYTIIPEPAGLLLLGFGMLVLRRKA